MSYPLIILGAGSSYDYLKIERFSATDRVILRKWRAPLVNDIFDMSRFSRISGKYEDIKPFASGVINIKDGDRAFNFEKYITEEEEKYPEYYSKVVMALRFYLAELFGKVSYYFFRHGNNHSHLVSGITKRSIRACFINFNYDTLLEKNIEKIGLSKKIDSYIQGDIKIIKIHGAHNWVFNPHLSAVKEDVYDHFTSNAVKLNTEYKNKGTYSKTMGNFDYEKKDFNINIFRKRDDMGPWLYYLPAIAIPIGTKAHYVCPKNHISILEEQLKEIDRILIIGWRAQDEYVLGLLKKHLPKGVRLVIVSKNWANAKKTSLKFSGITQIDNRSIKISKSTGYTSFMASEEYEKFLS